MKIWLTPHEYGFETTFLCILGEFSMVLKPTLIYFIYLHRTSNLNDDNLAYKIINSYCCFPESFPLEVIRFSIRFMWKITIFIFIIMVPSTHGKNRRRSRDQKLVINITSICSMSML